MNSVASPQSADSANLPINKKAKAVQKRLATENTVEAIQQKRSAAIYLRVSSEMQVDGFSIEAQKIACLKNFRLFDCRRAAGPCFGTYRLFFGRLLLRETDFFTLGSALYGPAQFSTAGADKRAVTPHSAL